MDRHAPQDVRDALAGVAPLTRVHRVGGIEGLDPVAFGGASALLLSVMLVASLLPANRAARLDLVEILKEG